LPFKSVHSFITTCQVCASDGADSGGGGDAEGPTDPSKTPP